MDYDDDFDNGYESDSVRSGSGSKKGKGRAWVRLCLVIGRTWVRLCLVIGRLNEVGGDNARNQKHLAPVNTISAENRIILSLFGEPDAEMSRSSSKEKGRAQG